MRLEEALRNFVRMPWEVCHGEQDYHDKEIAKILVSGCRAGDYFKNEPTPEYRDYVMQMIAEVLTISLTKQTIDSISAMQNFERFPDEQKDFIRKSLGIQLCHTSVLKITEDEELIPMIASYVAGAYALTTLTKPYVVDFDLLTDVANHSKIERCQQETDMRRAGLLVITDLDLPARTNIDTYSFLLNLLNMRSRKKRMNLFFHTPIGNLQRSYLQGKLPTRLEVVDAYLAAIPANIIIHNSFVGKNVHICDVDKMEASKKEQEEGKHEQYRKALVI